MRLSNLLPENIEADATLQFLQDIVRRSPFKNQVFLVGGAVRDMILGLPTKDIDLVVSVPDGGIQFATWLTKQIGVHSTSNPVVYPKFGTAKFNLRGLRFNGVDIGNMDIEAVMTRSEKYTDGSRKPDVEFGDLKQDAERRDFTVNSLMKNLTTGQIVDPTGMGLSDIKNGIIRTAIDPDIIFVDDPLRMLRAVRFAAKYGWKLTPDLVTALRNNAPLIKKISVERIQDEFNKMLITDKAAAAVRFLQEVGLTKHFLPELDATVGVSQGTRHHHEDVFNHLLSVMQNTPPKVLSRLAGLLHDIGKPETRTVGDDGHVHFYDHENVGAKKTVEIMHRLKYPNDATDRVSNVIANHMRLKQSGANGEKASDKVLRKFKADVKDLDMAWDVMQADNLAHTHGSQSPNQIPMLKARVEKLAEAQPKITLPIDGTDVMAILDIKPGPKVRQMLDIVKDAWFENPDISREEALALVSAADQPEKTNGDLPRTIRNPQTGNDILFTTAMGYEPDHPARKEAERIMGQKQKTRD